jgi:NaMN:DMB phosphoribosyltransferase
MDYLKLNNKIPAFDTAAADVSRGRWDGIAKPLGSLGLLEESVIRIAGITGSANVQLSRRGVIVLCADNGVVAEGVSQSGSEVTRIVAENLTRRQTSVCRMASTANADVIPWIWAYRRGWTTSCCLTAISPTVRKISPRGPP